MTEPVPAWMHNQAAVIPCRRRDRAIEVALITSSSGRRWVIPKGVIDPGESAIESARREALEEAGLVGTIHRDQVGRYSYRKWGGLCRVQVFLMTVTEALDNWDESDVRKRQWFTPDDAADQVRLPTLSNLLREVPALMEMIRR